MAAEVSADLNVIHDEDVLRRMWQHTDDFGRKKEIRQRMYKLREQRLRDFYTGDNSSVDMASRKHTSNTHTDSIADQGFMSLKSKEIRDSESPTRDIHRRQGDNTYWNTVQQSSYNDDGGVKSYERSSTGTGQSADGATQLKVEADERGFASTKTTETENARTVADTQQHDAQISAVSHTKTDSGEAYSYSTSQEHQEKSSSATESKDSSSNYKSNKWETSSVSSSSSRKVISSSNYGRISSDTDFKAVTSGDDVDFSNSFNRDEDFNSLTKIRVKNSSTLQDRKPYHVTVEHPVDHSSYSRTFIDTETRNNIRNNLQDINVNIIEDHFADRDSRRDSASTYTTEITSNVDDFSTQRDTTSARNVTVEKRDIERNSTAVDQKIMSEIHKLDSFLSTQNTTGTNTPASPRSVMGEVNWTVVSNNDGEFVYRDDKDIGSPGSRATPIKQPDNLDLPKDCTEGQYMTTYNEHYTSKRISVDVSPTHDKFARSLRQTPPGTPRSLSRQSLDRSSPERKTKNSPRSSPDKERRTSTGSYTIERPGSARRKSSEVTRQTAISKESSLKTKRKFSTTQNKADTKVRTSTPGTSPSTSPSRKHREMSESASSASDSDASQVTYDKKSTSSIHKRADVVRRSLMESFDKESPRKDRGSSETTTKSSSRPSSPEKSPSRNTSNINENKGTGILRKESITTSKTTISNTTEQKAPSGIAPHVRETSPEYSSEGSIGKEIKHSQRANSPDSSPERATFTPIKQFRTSPEVSSETIQVTASETDTVAKNQSSSHFIKQEIIDAQKHEKTINVDIIKAEKPQSSVDKRSQSPGKEAPERKTSQKQTKPRSESPQKESSSSVIEIPAARKNSYTRKESTFRGKSPQKEETPRSQSPTKSQTPRRPSVPHRSPSPQKEQPRSISPTKALSSRKQSVPARSPSPTKTNKSRPSSPAKKEFATTSTTITRKSSLKKDSSYSSPSPRRSSRQDSPSPVKDDVKSRSPSPKKDYNERKHSFSSKEVVKTRSSSPKKTHPERPLSPDKYKSASPQRTSNKRSHQQVSSPSVSPCSSPERTTEQKQDKSKPLRKSSGLKSPERGTARTTRRSSIPRSEQSTIVRKTVETKVEIRSKPTTKIPSSTSKPRQSPAIRTTRTDSQNGIDGKVTTKTYSTTIKKNVGSLKEPIKKTTPTAKKTVTTTAVISLQKPTVTSQVRQSTSSTVSRATTYNRTPSKETPPKKAETPNNKKAIITTTTKRIASRTNTPKSKSSRNNDETDRSSILSSPEPISPDKLTSEAFIDQLRKDESTIHGFKDELLTLEITDDLENETRPELYPETEDDDENVEKQTLTTTEENVHHKTEKTIQVDSKRKVASQFMVTIKKPAAANPTKPTTKPVTTRSSSGPVKGSPQSPAKTTTVTATNRRQVTNTVKKSDSLNLIRTSSDKNIPKNTLQNKRQISKPEMSTAKPVQQPTKTVTTKQVAETGIASRNVTTAKTATIKRVTPTKKKIVDTRSSSSSEDEGDNVPSVVTPNRQEQQYIEELEEMRRNEELEYASKLTATTNQENQLLSVIIQHPKSSRESSPDMSSRSQPFCTVSDDGGANPRYADVISEPEDVEVFNPKEKPKHESYIQRQPRFEQVTDLDEESETEEIKLNVSVADRVSHFIETSKNHAATTVREDTEPQTDGAKNVLKAAAMFETIAKHQAAPAAPNNKAPDILSRPSVFEARRGQVAPKPVENFDTFPRVNSPDNVQRRDSIQIDYQQESFDTHNTTQYEKTNVDVNEVTLSRRKSISPKREIRTPVKDETEPSNLQKTSPTQRELTTPHDLPEKNPKADPTSRTTKDSTQTHDIKKSDTPNKSRPFEKTISASAEISSKRAFFERKAQAETPGKQTKPQTSAKERKPLTESVQNKENIRGSSPTRRSSQTTTFIDNERKTSRTSPERKTSRPSPERKVSRPSPERKTSTTSPERKTSITSQERRTSTPAPAKERKHSIKSESPERKMSFSKSVKERRRSFTKDDITTSQTTTLNKKESTSKITTERKTSPERESPERRAPITLRNFPDHVSKPVANKDAPGQKSPSSPVKERKPSRESPERTPVRKSSRNSPERVPKSPERSSPTQKLESETVELNKAGKFGVTLRRTSSTTSAGTPRRTSVPGETQEIEDVTDLSLLEIMMEKAVGYEQRRRIRSQMRIVKKIQDDAAKATKQKPTTRSPSRQPTQEPRESKKPETKRPSSPTKSFQERVTVEKPETKRPSSPTKSYQERVTVEQRTIEKSETKRPSSPTKSYQERVTVEERSVRKTSKPSETTKVPAEQSRQAPLTNGYHRPGSPERMSPQRKESVAGTQGVRKTSKTEAVEVMSSVRSQKRVETLVESGVDCITSSYGVGPTDENGRPLFGLRALRRTNTNKQLSDELEGVSGTVEEVREVQEVRTEIVRDTTGRPLFGGLKALRSANLDQDFADMPEQTSSAQLRELVERHEKVVRETNGPQDQPRQKPRAKLRDSFILTEEENKDQQTEGHLTEVNNLNRGLSLRSIIQKHENIAGTAGTVHSEVESSHTVVSSRTAVSSDGSVSHNRDVIQGELSAKTGEEPVGKVTRTQYAYQSPRGKEDQGLNKVTTTTTTLGGRRTSGPRITEVEDDGKTTKRSSITEETSASKSVRKSSLKKTQCEDVKTDRRFSNQEDEETTKTTASRVSSTAQKFTSADDSKSKFSSSVSTRQTESRAKTTSPSLRRQKSGEEEAAVEEKRKAVVRGDSVRALQHKFQQATENTANSGARNSTARAGLILRTSSFTSGQQNLQDSVSSTLKQSTPLSAERKNGRESPEKRQESPTSDIPSNRRESFSKTSDATTTRRESLSKTSTDDTTRRESLTTTRVSETSSFLDNTSKVTGVQDILTRMRNADLVSESGDTDADREARALLNKFLGASVILQGMEQGMRSNNISSSNIPDGTPGSAALVSSVEKQRVATTRQTEEDIENIWDEQVLKTLLEQCTDYDGRRKLRARLRTVMAEHKACADLVALTGDSVANSESSESRQVTTRTEGNSFSRTEVHTKTSTNRLTKASSVSSPFSKFRQLERQNSAPSVGAGAPLFKVTDPRVARSASSIKDRLLSWVQAQTREYKNIQIDNFSTSWNNGLAFCALIHHFCPNAFDYDQLTPEKRRHNFELAFRVAEEEAGIAPLLDVEDMVVMRRPDWKCVFTYVQSVYRRFHSTPEAVRC